MKPFLLLTLLLSLCITCSKNTAGTEVEVSRGSIFGSLLTENEKIDDSVTVCVYDGETDVSGALSSIENDPVAIIGTKDGSYDFEDLDFGDYNVLVIKDSLIVGRSEKVTLDKDHLEKEVNITVNIIIIQTINIYIDSSKNTTINYITINNGKVEQKDNVFELTFPESDTIEIGMEVKEDDSTKTVAVRIIMENGTPRYEIIKSEIEIKVFSGTTPPDGHLGTITITIGKPGTITVESTFKTEDMPGR